MAVGMRGNSYWGWGVRMVQCNFGFGFFIFFYDFLFGFRKAELAKPLKAIHTGAKVHT